MWSIRRISPVCGLVYTALLASSPASAVLVLGAEEIVQADGIDIAVPGYSVPSFADWNGDDLDDLVVGEGGGGYSEGKVRVYVNVGGSTLPVFDDFFYAQSEGVDLVVPASGCLGIFPRVAYWDADERKDLLVGESGGNLSLFTNVGTDEEPQFDGGTYLLVGQPGEKVEIDVGSRATPTVVDWNADGRKDLVVGALDGKLRLYINEGTDDEPDFRTEQFAQEDGEDLIVPSGRSSPCILDLDDDGKKDLLTGNTEGRLLLYANVGTDEAPLFSGYVYADACGVPIDLPGSARSRPCLCDWTGDQRLDVLVGGGDGLVRLYQGVDPASVGVNRPRAISSAARLTGVYPNPSGGVVAYGISLAVPGRVGIKVLDVTGREVGRPIEMGMTAGEHTVRWEPTNDDGSRLPSGVYYLRLESDRGCDVRPIVLSR